MVIWFKFYYIKYFVLLNKTAWFLIRFLALGYAAHRLKIPGNWIPFTTEMITIEN